MLENKAGTPASLCHCVTVSNFCATLSPRFTELLEQSMRLLPPISFYAVAVFSQNASVRYVRNAVGRSELRTEAYFRCVHTGVVSFSSLPNRSPVACFESRRLQSPGNASRPSLRRIRTGRLDRLCRVYISFIPGWLSKSRAQTDRSDGGRFLCPRPLHTSANSRCDEPCKKGT